MEIETVHAAPAGQDRGAALPEMRWIGILRAMKKWPDRVIFVGMRLRGKLRRLRRIGLRGTTGTPQPVLSATRVSGPTTAR